MEIKFKILQNYLKLNKIETEVTNLLPNYDCLEWKDSKGDKNRVYQGDILLNESDELKAYQKEILNSKGNKKHFLRIINLTDIFSTTWELKMIDRDDENCQNIYLGVHKNKLIHVYKNAGYISISSYGNKGVENFSYAGELIKRKGEIIAIERYQKEDNTKPVELIKIPELEKLKSITREKAKAIGLTPSNNKSNEELMGDT